MQPQQILEIAKVNISFNKKHKHYDETVKLRDFYQMCISGEGTEKEIVQFVRSETKEQKEQRAALTIENISPAIAPVYNKINKIDRMNNVREFFTVKDSGKQQSIKEAADKFYEENDIKYFLAKKQTPYAVKDPNAFLVLDFTPFDPTGQNQTLPKEPEFYPVIFDCDDVYDFSYSHKGILEYLFTCIQTTLYKQETNESAIVNDYFMFYPGGVYQLKEKHEYRTPEGNYIEIWEDNNKKTFYVYQVVNGSTKVKNQVQAVRFGSIQHQAYHSICISILHPAKPLLKDALRHKSGFDISALLHIFPKLLRYADFCKGDGINTCAGGKQFGTTNDCTECNGTGFKQHRSAQDTIEFPLPTATKEHIPLDEMAHYLNTDIETVKFLLEYLIQLKTDIFEAVFNINKDEKISGFGLGQGQKAVQNIKDPINDTLFSFAENKAKMARFIYKQIAIFLDTDIVITFEYDKRFELETIDEVVSKIEGYRKAGVSETLIIDTERQVAELQFENEPEALKRYEVRCKFLPFHGKDPMTKSSLLNSNFVSDRDKMLYANFDNVFTMIEQDKNGIDFYNKDYATQLKLVDEKIGLIFELLNTQPMLPSVKLAMGIGNEA